MDVMFDNLPSSMPHIKARQAQGAGGDQRAALGRAAGRADGGGGRRPALKGFEASSWFGLLAPAGTPPDIVNRIQQETAKALATPAMKERLLAQGAIPSGNTPAAVRPADRRAS